VDLHEIKLQVGEVTSTVEVQASSVHVATDSSDRSVDIGLRQIEDTPTRGRNPLSLIMTLPGVQTLQSLDYRRWSGGGIPGINGGQTGQVVLNMDGAASQDSGNLNPGYISPSVDSVAEVKVLVSNYTAEYGGRTGGQFTLTTKSGTPQFHGTAYYYLRHEMFDANEWFNNKLNIQKPKYRYQNPGGTIGGPLIIPGTRFNKNRQKLFFFSPTIFCATPTPSITLSRCPRPWSGRAISRRPSPLRACRFRSTIRTHRLLSRATRFLRAGLLRPGWRC
jgi:hypothetical protein